MLWVSELLCLLRIKQGSMYFSVRGFGCALFYLRGNMTNICNIIGDDNSKALTVKTISDLQSLISHLIRNESVSIFYLAEKNNFSIACTKVLQELKKHFSFIEIISSYPHGIPSDEIGDYILCDNITKERISHNLDIDYIIEKPYSKCFLIVKKHTDIID